LRVFATVGFPVLKFNAVKRQFVAIRIVPQAVVHRCKGNRNAVKAASDEGKTHITEATQHPLYAANGPEIRNG
jgi:hypothetical protein